LTRRALSVLSASLILIATVGFSSIPFFLEELSSDLARQNADILERQQFVYRQHLLGKNYLDIASIRGDYVKLLALLSQNRVRDSVALVEINTLNLDAILACVNTAIYTRAVPESDRDSVINNFASWNLAQQNTAYHYYDKKANRATKALADELESNKLRIANINSKRTLVWWTCIACQSAGLLLGLLLIVRNKRANE
jgi:hypothetical protein